VTDVRRPHRSDPFVARLLDRTTLPALDGPVVCAVSGGADSTSLLALAVAAGLEVTAVHVDHGLRPGSEREADRVAAVADAWGAAFRSVRVEVAPGPDLEARARAARQAAVGNRALFGHTADDQAETVLLRLLRGTGPAGLAAMRRDRHPLLALRRCDTVELCRHLGVVPVEDPTNTEPRFRRNRVRHEVLPLLADVAGRDVVPLLCRLADLAAGQADLLADLAGTVDAEDAAALAATPVPLAAEAVRRRWAEVTGGAPPPDASAVRRVLEVAGGGAVACEVADGWEVRRSAGRLRWRRVEGTGSAPRARSL
jgi:tRNA(Ile)-lysidine synthase